MGCELLLTGFGKTLLFWLVSLLQLKEWESDDNSKKCQFVEIGKKNKGPEGIYNAILKSERIALEFNYGTYLNMLIKL